ncbi:MAG TPA: hypothetical protein DHW63_12440, partial [Hyphomonadaceae bacterium]|nr:hypothetical protein [Hyphomonadaceae bacterium]
RVLMAVSAAAVVFAGLAGGAGILWLRAAESEARAVHSLKQAEEARSEAESAALEARRTAAQASFYEGLYWLRTANERATALGGDRLRQWATAAESFNRGLNTLGALEGTIEGQDLRELLSYGRKITFYCAGLGSMDTASYPDAHVYFTQRQMPTSCPIHR